MSVTEIHRLNCTTLRLRSARVFDGHAGMLDDLVCVTHCLLVETSTAGLVLVDAGFSTQAVSGPRRPSAGFNFLFRPSWKYEETAAGSIEALGLDPREVRHIVLTHLDLDHADGVTDFPWATVHAYTPEWRALRFGTSWRDRMRYDREPLQRHEHWETRWWRGSNAGSWAGPGAPPTRNSSGTHAL